MNPTLCFRRAGLVVLAGVICSLLPSPAAAQQVETYSTRIAAPSLDGGGEWLNTAAPLDLRLLRGKFVILDFWTYCCINCMHVLPELKKLEHEFPEHVVVIGVHSAKFFAERDAKNVSEAIERYGIEHPVVNDPLQVLWRKYAVDTWPSLRIIDPEGFLIGHLKGEFTAETVGKFVRQNIPAYRRKRVLDDTPLSFTAALVKPEDKPLRFPGKVLADAVNNKLTSLDASGIFSRTSPIKIAISIRPIFMTTLTTVFGLAPLVLFPGAGSELYRGLGSVVLGGLIVSTVFTLLLVPTLFSLMMDAKKAVVSLIGWTGVEES